MALPLGKLTIIIGAGIVGSILAQERGESNVSSFFSGALKVNSLREELQLLASNRSITIVTSSGSGFGRYCIIVIVIVVGYGYIWWKGWKFSDMMFATRRSLSDACSSISKQLENVYSTISVSKLRGDLRLMGADVQSVHHVVRSLGETLFGVGKLVSFVRNLENSRTLDPIEGPLPSSSRPALELSQLTPFRAVLFPSSCSVESSSPAVSIGHNKRPLQGVALDSGLKLHEVSNGVQASSQSSSQISNEVRVSEVANNKSSDSGLFGLNSSGGAFNTIRRNYSAKPSFNI